MRHRDRTNEPKELRPQAELELSDREEREIIERLRPNAIVIHEAIRIEGESELRRPVSALAWSGLAAGLSMGFSLVGRGLLIANLPNQPWRHIIASLGYTIGFVIVVMGRQQLFTENTVTAILPLLSRRSRRAFMKVLRLWTTVLLSNLLGTLLFACIVGYIEVFPPEVQKAFAQIGLDAMAGGFWTLLVQAIFAGWLIALMVWLLPTAESSQLWVIIIITAIIGLGKLPHIIAGSVEVLYVAITGTTDWGAYLSFAIPTLLGNILGGVSLVAVVNHAQVAPQKT